MSLALTTTMKMTFIAAPLQSRSRDSLQTHVQGVASQVFDFSRNSSETSALSPKNCPKISISCRQPLNVGPKG
jgi:hypothetical protein